MDHSRPVRTCSRTLIAAISLIAGSLLWVAPPAVAQVSCVGTPPGSLIIDPPDGQYPGDFIWISGSGWPTDVGLSFSLGGVDLGTIAPNQAGAFIHLVAVPQLAPGDHTFRYAWYPLNTITTSSTHCTQPYPVLINLTPFLTIPTFAIIDDVIIATATTSGIVVLETTSTTTTTLAPPTTAPTTTTIATTTTTSADSTTIPPDTTNTTLVTAAPPDEGGSSGVGIGALVGLGVAAVLAAGWLLGRRGKTVPIEYEPPPPPPPA